MPSKSLVTAVGFAADVQERPSIPDASAQKAFASVVERHSAMVLGVCRRVLGEADAEDAGQAVFILFWQKAMRIQGESQVAGWLHRTALHVCRNAIRSRIARGKHEQQAAAEARTMVATPAETAQWNEIREILDEEVSRLPDKLRIPFLLFHCENRTLAEVAEQVGSTVPTVGTWLQRSREKLAERLRRRHIVVGAAALATILSQHLVVETASAEFVTATVQTVAEVSTNGLAGCTPAVASLVKAGVASGWSKSIWFASILIAAAMGFPLLVIWLLPALQTWQSPDYPLLQGEWREVAVEQDGRPVNATPAIAYVGTLRFFGRSFQRIQTLPDGSVLQAGSGSFTLDSSQDPAAINFRQWQGTAHGIYELDGDKLTICVTRNGGPRPGGLSTTKNDDRILSRYQRVQ